VTGRHLGKPLEPPVNTHISHAFLMNCRKMYDFFVKSASKDRATAAMFRDKGRRSTFALSAWERWQIPMNKQLLHVTFRENPKRWDGREENTVLLAEFQAAWKAFLEALPQDYRRQFDVEIDKKLATEFRGLDLR
jgi:hypothetical protein